MGLVLGTEPSAVQDLSMGTCCLGNQRASSTGDARWARAACQESCRQQGREGVQTDHIAWGRWGGRGAGRVVKEWVGNRCLSRVEGAHSGCGEEKARGTLWSAPRPRVMRAPHIESPALGLGRWVTWVPGDTELGFKKRFHKGHKRCLSWPRTE